MFVLKAEFDVWVCVCVRVHGIQKGPKQHNASLSNLRHPNKLFTYRTQQKQADVQSIIFFSSFWVITHVIIQSFTAGNLLSVFNK